MDTCCRCRRCCCCRCHCCRLEHSLLLLAGATSVAAAAAAAATPTCTERSPPLVPLPHHGSGSPSPGALLTLREMIVEQAAKGKRILVRASSKQDRACNRQHEGQFATTNAKQQSWVVSSCTFQRLGMTGDIHPLRQHAPDAHTPPPPGLACRASVAAWARSPGPTTAPTPPCWTCPTSTPSPAHVGSSSSSGGKTWVFACQRMAAAGWTCPALTLLPPHVRSCNRQCDPCKEAWHVCAQQARSWCVLRSVLLTAAQLHNCPAHLDHPPPPALPCSAVWHRQHQHQFGRPRGHQRQLGEAAAGLHSDQPHAH